MLFDPATPVFHTVFEVGREERDDLVDFFLKLNIRVDRVSTSNLKFSALQQPAMETGVDAIFLCLCWLSGDTA